MLELVSRPEFTFQEFSARVLSGAISDGAAELVVLKRYREDGNAKHKFISLQVATEDQNTYWLRIERSDVNPSWFLACSATGTSLDTVVLGTREPYYHLTTPACTLKTTVTFDGDRKPTLKDVAQLLQVISMHSVYTVSKLNSTFVAAVIEETLANPDKSDFSIQGQRAQWAVKHCRAERAVILSSLRR